jgi:Putative Ig domain
VRVPGIAFAAAACAAIAVGGSGAASGVSLPRVTLIGDSVSSAIAYDPAAMSMLSDGVVLSLQAAACRRLAGASCPEVDGTIPPTAVQLISSLGPALGPTVIVAVGYNDPEDAYGAEIQQVLAALHQQGVQHILWLTLRAARHPYLTMNDEIRAAAAADPAVNVVDWNLYSRSHPDWFQADGIHPVRAGAEAMAKLLHRRLIKLGIVAGKLEVGTLRLPDARVRKPYSAVLAASGGTPPYRWTPVSMPRGFSITPTGNLFGRPEPRAESLRLTVRVTDASGAHSARAYVLHVLG